MKVGKNKKGRDVDIPSPEAASAMSDEQIIAKLQSLGVKIDRKSMQKLCDRVLSVEELAEPFEEDFDDRNEGKGFDVERQGDWIWICLTELWKRWFPDKACFELLFDCIHDGYDLRKQKDEPGALQSWLRGWKMAREMMDESDVSVEQFHHEFDLENSLCDWLQDISLALRSVSLDDTNALSKEVEFYQEVLKRTKGNHLDLFVQNMRMNLAEAMFDHGKSAEVDALYEDWLRKDPQWGWGWISWAYCYVGGRNSPENPDRVIEILQKGLSTKGLRNRLDVLEKLAEFLEAQGRTSEADAAWSEFEREEAKAASNAPQVTASSNNRFDAPTMAMLKDAIDRAEDERTHATAPGDSIGRKEPCPCGSGKKYKRCCGK